MRTKLQTALMIAVAITAIFTVANQTPALASDHEDESTIQHVVPDLFDQKAGQGDADHFVVGNAMTECNQLGYDYGYKKDDPESGTDVGIGDGMSISYSFDGGNQGTILEWESNLGIDAVILKASTKANVYAYDPEATEDAGLRTPFRVSKKGGKKYYGISHVTFCWDRELLVTKTAAGIYDTDHDWSLSKNIAADDENIFVGETAHYTITVDYEGAEYTNVNVGGTITLDNPWSEASPATTLTDVISVGTATGGFSATVPSIAVGGTHEIAYAELLMWTDSGNAPSAGTNIATVAAAGTWGGNSAEVPVSSWTELNVIDETVNITDSFDGGPAIILGSFTADEGGTINTTSAPSNADSYINTACVDDNNSTNCDSATVTVHELSVSKTAETSLARSTGWSIDKVAGDPEQADLPDVLVFGDVVCDTLSGSCYEYVSDPTNWTDAANDAGLLDFQGVPGHLAAITSSDENSFIVNHVPAAVAWLTRQDVFEGGAWIGALDTKDAVCYDFAWVTPDPWSYANWAGSEPNLCAELGDQAAHYWGPVGTWNNDAITRLKGYLVEYTNVVLPAEYTIGYSVTVTGTPVDSDWTVSGGITVSNPNPDHDALVDVYDEGELVASGVVIPMGGSSEILYSIDREDGSDGTNTASATNTLGGDTVYSDAVPFTFDTAQIIYIDNDADVVDVATVDGGTPVSSGLGTADAGDDGAFSYIWNYSLTVGPFDCDTAHAVNNTATVTALDSGSSGSSSTVVDITTADCGTIVDPEPPLPGGDHDSGHETAFMLGNQCFIDIGFTRWGWSYEWGQDVTLQAPLSGTASVVDGSITLPIYAGRGQCDETNGEYVGDVTIDQATGTFSVVMLAGQHLDEIHIEYDEIGEVAELGSGSWTVAPGKYDWVEDVTDGTTAYTFSTGSPIADGTWLIVHMVSGENES